MHALSKSCQNVVKRVIRNVAGPFSIFTSKCKSNTRLCNKWVKKIFKTNIKDKNKTSNIKLLQSEAFRNFKILAALAME